LNNPDKVGKLLPGRSIGVELLSLLEYHSLQLLRGKTVELKLKSEGIRAEWLILGVMELLLKREIIMPGPIIPTIITGSYQIGMFQSLINANPLIRVEGEHLVHQVQCQVGCIRIESLPWLPNPRRKSSQIIQRLKQQLLTPIS